MNTEEKLEISKKLQSHHYFFRAFWDIGNPVVGKFNDLDTAAITFDKEGNSINLLINEEYWNLLNESTKLFLICHEMSHIVFEHGFRFKEYWGTEDFLTMNQAADVVTNETLCRSFGFNRYELNADFAEKGCWLDTVFPDQKISPNESTEFYFNLLKKNPPKTSGLLQIDEHRVISSEDITEITNILQETGVLDTLDPTQIPNLNPEMSQQAQKLAGTGTGSMHSVNAQKKVKKKWETVIKKWESFYKKEDLFSEERWDRINPRYSQIITPDVHLPMDTKLIEEKQEKNKLEVFFFLDTSGSCIGLKDRFFSAALSLDPKKFDIRLFCFDTRVQETTLTTQKIYGGGGTCFRIIEDAVQKYKKKKYPQAVFVITDGYGTTVQPQYPKKWYWFLTHNVIHCIPKESKIYKLSDYE